ncbi:hypothetical protein LJY18_16720 [Pseudomonas sp. MMS21-TM103]|uniref:ABC transporter substrate-binding protein n=1 Tax=Pseudomonas sp. MMS21 TM103 TaxID=2886506 RepID=UPI001EDE1F26|nr:hypothetical protein [Pseudomonas sp. MMS21 TM103]MCG4454925.1 hypothetical protein [Pseudomonas sp. MMS21 TM103]
MTKRKLRVMWFVPPAIAVVAAWNERLDFTLESSKTHSSDEQFDALVNGRIDAVVTSIDNVLHWNQRSGPKDFVVVAQVEATTPLRLIGRPNLSTPADLLGGNILVDAPENGFVVALMSILHANGLNVGDYSMLQVGGVVERYNSLVQGRGDATLLGPPFDSLAIKQGLKEIASVQNSYPEFPGQGVVIRKANADSKIALEIWLAELAHALSIIPFSTERLQESLALQGMPDDAVCALMDSVPKTLTPDKIGVQLLIDQRARLALAGSDSTYSQIIDCTYLT